jgi:hypothetical protein
MKSKLYFYPQLPRAGLGNMLFPWARAELAAARHGVPMLAPQWTLPRIGPWLRGERDKRHYLNLFHSKGYVRGPARWWLLATARRITEEEFARDPNGHMAAPRRGPLLVVFQGYDTLFRDLIGQHRFLHQRIVDILNPRLHAAVSEGSHEPFIGVHIRRGDFQVLAPGQRIPPGQWNWQIGDDWYLGRIHAVREILGSTFPVRIFSDARPEQLEAFRALPYVRIMEPQPAIVDILRLAASRVLIASGSTFSMWASFLGGPPTLWYPGQLRQRFFPDRHGWEVETDDDQPLSPEFTAHFRPPEVAI